MRTLERKKNNSFNSLLLFLLSSVLVHGLLLLIFAKSRRSLPITKPKTNQNPIDFVVVPPEEKIKEPPPETTKIATDNSVAKGKVKPDLPVASNKVGEKPTAVKAPAQSQAIKTPNATKPSPAVKPITPKASLKPEPKPQPKQITPPQPQENKPPIKPEVVKTEPKPQIPQKTEAIKPLPIKPEPVKPEPAIAKAPKKALPLDKNHPLLSKPQTKKQALVPEQTIAKPNPNPTIAKAPKNPTPTISKQPKKPAPTQPDANALAATTRTTQPQIPKTIPQPAKVIPQPQKAPAPDANSGAASLLGGNLSKNSATDQGSTFFSAQANASQTALNFNNQSNARRDPNLGPYFAEVRRRVKRNWKPSRPNDTKQTVLTFSIQSNGQISGLKVTQSSGSEQIDRESLAAVQNAAPFAALPTELGYPQLNVEFNFNLYIY